MSSNVFVVREHSARTGYSNLIGVATTWDAAKMLAQSGSGVPELTWKDAEYGFGFTQSENYHPLTAEEFSCYMTISMCHITTEAHAKQLLAVKEASK